MTMALGIAQGSFGRVALLDMDSSLVAHAHHHSHILLKVDGPDRSFVVNGAPLPVRDDTAILVNAWEPHQYNHPAPTERTLFLALYIEPAWIAGIERSLAPEGRAGLFSRSCVPISGDLRRLCQRLTQCLAASANGPDEIEELIGDLALAIMHRYAERLGPRSSSPRPRLQDFRIRRALRHMHEQPGRFDLDGLAQMAGLSRPRFNQLFRQCAGVSPGLYGNALRVERAVQGLGQHRRAAGALSEELGFSAQGNFSRFFQQHTGVSPSQFRRVALPVGDLVLANATPIAGRTRAA
jgi:AraC family transcriptional regulator